MLKGIWRFGSSRRSPVTAEVVRSAEWSFFRLLQSESVSMQLRQIDGREAIQMFENSSGWIPNSSRVCCEDVVEWSPPHFCFYAKHPVILSTRRKGLIRLCGGKQEQTAYWVPCQNGSRSCGWKQRWRELSGSVRNVGDSVPRRKVD